MFGSLGAPEFIIIGIVLILLFGVGKISGLGRELGGSIKEFRRAVKDEDAEAAKQAAQQAQQAPAPPPPPAYAQAATPPAPPPPQAQQAPPPPSDKNPSIF